MLHLLMKLFKVVIIKYVAKYYETVFNSSTLKKQSETSKRILFSTVLHINFNTSSNYPQLSPFLAIVPHCGPTIKH